jgi:hypothetical protein
MCLRGRARTPRRATRHLCGLAALTLALLAPGASAGAATKGVVTDLTWGLSPSDQDRTGQVIADTQAKWVLISLAWSEAEPDQDDVYSNYAFEQLDRAVEVARAAGAKVLVTVYTSPQWASGSADPNTPPVDPEDYADFMGYVAERYAGRVSAWEIWNEENLMRFWKPAPDAAAYAALIKAAYPAVKAGDPSALVLFGGTQHNDYGFLEEAYAAEPDLSDYFDAMAVHPYVPGGGDPETENYHADGPFAGRMTRESFPAYQEVRATLDAQGDDDKLIWITEMGWSTTPTDPWGVSEATQADYVTRAYQQVAQHDYVPVALWYNLRNNWFMNDGNEWDAQLGLLRTDFSPKPSYFAFRAIDYVPPPGEPTPAPTVNDATVGGGSGGGTTPPPAKQRTAVSLTVSRVIGVASRTRSAASRPPRVLLAGTVRNARRGVVRMVLQRRIRGRWVTVATRGRTLRPAGRFTVSLGSVQPGPWRARALFLGSFDRLPSRSGWRSFTVPAVRRAR